MENEELRLIIPSETVRSYVLETGWTFTDAQKATLLAHSWIGDLPLEDQFSHLRTLRDSTSDSDLKVQITMYLDRMERHLRELHSNQDRSCIYILKVETDEDGDNYYRISPEGYFFDYEMAHEYGRKLNRPFQIEKLHVAGMPDEDNYVITYIQFDKTGKAIYLSHEYENTEEEKFVNAFFLLPNPFERGDIVRRIGSEDYGIVETSQKHFQEKLRERKPHLYTEFGDDQIRIVFLNGDCTFSHEHVIPIYLERYQPEWESRETEDGTRDNLLLAASAMYKGEGSLDELWYFTMEYRQAKNNFFHEE